MFSMFTLGGCSIDTVFNNDILAISTEMIYYILYYTYCIFDVVKVYIYFLLRLSLEAAEPSEDQTYTVCKGRVFCGPGKLEMSAIK